MTDTIDRGVTTLIQVGDMIGHRVTDIVLSPEKPAGSTVI